MRKAFDGDHRAAITGETASRAIKLRRLAGPAAIVLAMAAIEVLAALCGGPP